MHPVDNVYISIAAGETGYHHFAYESLKTDHRYAEQINAAFKNTAEDLQRALYSSVTGNWSWLSKS
tara:strand:- start:498 stop:695 length:198 start_codon:yes stop_codon:yes gene_type:complete